MSKRDEHPSMPTSITSGNACGRSFQDFVKSDLGTLKGNYAMHLASVALPAFQIGFRPRIAVAPTWPPQNVPKFFSCIW